ncbi:MAG: PAS domain S-box protein [Syntrophales bacterium]|nr:PAS domain S-box protein [Syntrophales bacterium]
MKRSLLLWISFIVFLATPLLHAAEAAEPSERGTARQEILILNSYHPGFAWSDDEQAGIIDVFRAKEKNWLPVIEYLDLKRLPDGRHLAELKKLFRLKYQNKKFSAVIAMDNPALEFAIDNQAELFGNAPIVFCGINNYTPSLLKGRSDVTGIVEAIDIAGTIEVMLRLHPATREIFVPHDYTVTGLAARKVIEALVPRFGPKVRFRFTDPMTLEELLKELERLPRDSLVLPISFITDKSGRTFGITESTRLFSEHSPVPTYSTFEQRLGFGIVGGKLLSARIHGTNAARIALRVLAGEKASAIPVVFESDSQFMFDYKVMSRFGIPLSALPEGSTVINKPVSFYAAHRVVIQTALVVIVFLAVVISLLTINIIQRRRSSEVIRRSEERFKVIASSTPDHLIVQDKDLRYSFVMNPQLGLTEQDMIGKTDYDFLSKEDADKLTEIKRQVLKTGSPAHVEVPLTSSKGGQQFFDGSYVPKFDAKGQVDGLIGYFRNVTEHKRAEEALRESEEYFKAIIQNSSDIILIVDRLGTITYASPSTERFLGYGPDELIGKRTLDLIVSDDKPRAIADFGRALLTKEIPIPNVFRIRHKNGTERILEGIGKNLLDNPIVAGFVMNVRDITERKQAEEALRWAEENFHRSLDDSPLGVRIVTAEGETIYANRAILDIYGYNSIEELNTTPGEKRYTPESYAEFQIRRGKRKREDYCPSEYEISIVRKDGEVRRLQVFRKAILWDGEKQFQIIYQEITERKKAEEEVARVARDWQGTFNATNDVILILDQDQRVLRLNKTAERFFHRPLGEMIGKHCWEIVHGTMEPIPECPIPRLRKSLRRETMELQVGERFFEVISDPILDVAGQYSGTVHIISDITERKQADEALRASREQLRALAGRLQAVREEERTQIAREIHDELGGALTGLKIDFSLLTRAALKIENETVRTSLLAGMDSMTKFIDATIQTVRRIAMELRPGVLDDLGLVAALEWQLKDFEKRTGIRCEFFPPVEDISLDDDLSTALFRIFQEALTNVARHSGATEVRVRLRADADSSTLEVEDNGKGIEKEKTLSKESLGLLGMRERAQMFGGRITVAGTPGIGTTVTVEIPPVEKRKMDRDQGGGAG